MSAKMQPAAPDDVMVSEKRRLEVVALRLRATELAGRVSELSFQIIAANDRVAELQRRNARLEARARRHKLAKEVKAIVLALQRLMSHQNTRRRMALCLHPDKCDRSVRSDAELIFKLANSVVS